MLQAATITAVRRMAPAPVWAVIEPGDIAGYARLLCERWAAGEDLLVVEQDVVPPDGWLDDLDACPNPWCVIEPELRPGVAWFGCVRWRAELMAAHPALMAEALYDNSTDGDLRWTWHKVDVRFERTAREMHLVPCFHGPFARHLRVARA